MSRMNYNYSKASPKKPFFLKYSKISISRARTIKAYWLNVCLNYLHNYSNSFRKVWILIIKVWHQEDLPNPGSDNVKFCIFYSFPYIDKNTECWHTETIIFRLWTLIIRFVLSAIYKSVWIDILSWQLYLYSALQCIGVMAVASSHIK